MDPTGNENAMVRFVCSPRFTLMNPLFFAFSISSGIRASVSERSEAPIPARLAGEYPVMEGFAKFYIYGKTRSWPAVVDSHDGLLLVTDTTADQLVSEGIRGYKLFDAELEFRESFTLLAKSAPRYFWLKPLGSIEIDESRIKEVSEHHGGFERTYPIRETWNGGDFIRIAKRTWNSLYCSRRIVEIARKYRWKSLMFNPMDMEQAMFVQYVEGRDWIDYLGKKWPPDWYPPGMQGDPSNLEETDNV